MKLHTWLPELCKVCSYTGSSLIADEEGDEYRTGGVLVIGEAGGYNEARLGRPFVGRSGEYLERLLASAGLSRSMVYICNTVRHTPPGNRTPTTRQREEHRAVVVAALDYAAPSLIISMGASALAWFRADLRLTACHGYSFKWGGTTVVPMFHPAYAMRNPSVWPLLVDDFRRVQEQHFMYTSSLYKRLSADALTDRLQELSPGSSIGFDLETTDVVRAGIFYPHEQRVLGYSVAFGEGDSVWVYGEPCWKMVDVLEDARIKKVCHNAKFEYTVLQNHGVTLRGYEDTKIAAYLLGHRSTHLKDLSGEVLGVEQARLDNVRQGRPTSEVGADEWTQYAAADADVTLCLWHLLERRLHEEGLWELYEKFERPLVPILAQAERVGVSVDADMLRGTGDRLREQLGKLSEMLQKWLPGVNLESSQQIGEVLFGSSGMKVVPTQVLKTRTHVRFVPSGLGMKATKYTKGGQPSVDKEALGRLEHPCVKVLQEYRLLGDYLHDFVDKIPRLLSEGVLHCSINQAGGYDDEGGKESPATGRLSSSGPNLMQIPVRTELGQEVRRAFKARPGYVWVSMDVQQEEARLLALVANEGAMLEVFENGKDIYWPLAEHLKQVLTRDRLAQLTSKDERDKWGLKYRDTAKTVFLGMQYGAQVQKIQTVHPGLSMGAAAQIRMMFDKMYPGVLSYIKQTEKELAQRGFVTSWLGRKRWLPGVWVKEQRAEAVRQACNHPIQGTGADVLKGMLVRLFGEGGGLRGCDVRFLFPVHDSVEMEVAVGEFPAVIEVLRQSTEWFTAIRLPVDIKVGPSWGELKEVADGT